MTSVSAFAGAQRKMIDMGSLTADADGTPVLAPLLAQFDTSLELLLERLDGLTDDEYRWSPVPGAADLVPVVGDELVAIENDGGEAIRTIAWMLAHLVDGFLTRADHVDGTHSLAEAYGPFPSSAEEAVEQFARAAARWRSAVAGADGEQAGQVGYSQYPGGLDRTLPFVDVVWWVNRELIHHGADIALIRDLYLALGE
ncbi:DinB family protein [uncultured Jatrophihabitans sp.]|uniref:DinB family protein n=1 Tax=uncultured Jatrophihabitans sp. TaxID=1610747 RepID=UPI0035CBA12D